MLIQLKLANLLIEAYLKLAKKLLSKAYLKVKALQVLLKDIISKEVQKPMDSLIDTEHQDL